MKGLILLGCLTLVACGGGSDSSPGAPNSATETTFTGSVALHREVEVNDDIAMANPVTLPDPAPDDDFVGFQVDGTIQTSIDGADTFAFTADRRHFYGIELCTFPCEYPSPGASMRLSVGYFDVLDQDGKNLLTSNSHNGGVGNYREIIIEAGVLYYVAIIAQDTQGAAQSYSLIAVEIPGE